MSPFYEEFPNQDLVIAPKKLSPLFLFINKMEKKACNYSTKNISIPTERKYNLQLVEKIKIFIKRMRWKAIMYDTSCKQSGNVEKEGVKSPRNKSKNFTHLKKI